MGNANPRHFLGWYILNSKATADQNLEDGGIKHNLRRCRYGTKTTQTLRNQCGSAVYKSHFSSIVQFFLHCMEDLSNLIHNDSYGDEDKECLRQLSDYFLKNFYDRNEKLPK